MCLCEPVKKWTLAQIKSRISQAGCLWPIEVFLTSVACIIKISQASLIWIAMTDFYYAHINL